MITEISAVPWQKSLSLDRKKPPPVFNRFLDPPPEETHPQEILKHNHSFLYAERLKKNLEESRKAFKDFCIPSPENEETTERKPPCKRISFKIKKTASIYRKFQNNRMNSVAELTNKFNEMNEKQNEQHTVAQIVKRVNSLRMDECKVLRKPSVKMKPKFKTERPIVIRKVSVKKSAKIRKLTALEHESAVDEPDGLKTEPASPGSNVRATIQIFESKTKPNQTLVPKPQVPEKSFKILNSTKRSKVEEIPDIVEIVNIPLQLPKKCDSLYESQRRITPPKTLNVSPIPSKKANSSFLWRKSLEEKLPKIDQSPNWEDTYDKVDVPKKPPPTPPPKIFKKKMPLPEPKQEEKLYEELNLKPQNHNYEDLEPKTDDGYEYCRNPDVEENIYETLPIKDSSSSSPPPPLLPRRREDLLPPRPPSRNSYCTIQNSEEVSSNCYESIYTSDSKTRTLEEVESTYESIYGCHIGKKHWSTASNRDSIVSSEHQSNSLYGQSITSWAEGVFDIYLGKATSDLSSSDKSDDWVDISDSEDKRTGPNFIIIRERQKVSKKASAWSQQLRDQRNKTPKLFDTKGLDSDDEHHYETLNSGQIQTHEDDFDSFDSDSDSDASFTKHDSGVDMGNTQLPDPPNNQTYVLTRLAASAGKHMKKLRRNWSLTKNDITKSLSRMTKKKSRTDLTTIDNNPPPLPSKERRPTINVVGPVDNSRPYQNMEFKSSNGSQELESPGDKNKSLPRKGFLNKFRRSMSMSADSASEITQTLNKPKSTFYLTETIDIDGNERLHPEKNKENVSPVSSNYKAIQRPQSPPPPTPNNLDIRNGASQKPLTKRSTSWYAECGLFKNTEPPMQNSTKRPNSCWYAEVGLYQTNTSTPCTSSAENSGNTTSLNVSDSKDYSEEYYNMKNQSNYYNRSIGSVSSGDSKSESDQNDNHLKLQDEPLYQFYDAALHEMDFRNSTDSDSDGYEEVGHKRDSITSTTRPSAMEIVAPNKNILHIRRLWCEIPEVIQSTVLSSLNINQMKLQEAKFEMFTSEASYLNSLLVLNNHFIKNLNSCELLTYEEKELLFGRVQEVKACSEKLMHDLEQCWQNNILLHGICDIIKTHAEDNFKVYITYCENQILIDSQLKKLKERIAFTEELRKLELNPTCQSLSLYSFLMLPMQRITRWPLLVEAVLKRLSPEEEEYMACQSALNILNKTVNQCNEAARKMERKTELEKISSQLEFAKGIAPIRIFSNERWLIKSGQLMHMQNRGEDVKLTFGKRFTKVPLHLFLFNDMLVVTKSKSEDCYTVLHYCQKNLIEINTDGFASLPMKDLQGRYLIFLTILENQEEKAVEFLFSCSSETDRVRWLEVLSTPKSENPDETLYEIWDCPQVKVIHNYDANQRDELSLTRGEVINVDRKMADGWYHGIKSNEESGWFPSNYVVEVANSHVRARNLKQRHRLLTFSENYLKAK